MFFNPVGNLLFQNSRAQFQTSKNQNPMGRRVGGAVTVIASAFKVKRLGRPETQRAGGQHKKEQDR